MGVTERAGPRSLDVAGGSALVNPLTRRCPEGQFLTISDGKCRQLLTPYGFDWDDFPGYGSLRNITVDNASDLKAEAAKGNVYIRVVAGAYDVSDIRPGSNVVIEGAGYDKTVIHCAGTSAIKVINGHGNVVVRDLGVIGDWDTCHSAVYFDDGGKNLLVEGVKSQSTRAKGFGGDTAAHQLTVRYSWVDGTRDYHGIGVDDGFSDVAFYSNYITNTGTQNDDGYSFDIHATQVELAGNYTENTHFGMKNMDGQDVLVHHNHFDFSTATRYAYLWAAKDRVRCPYDLVYAFNHIEVQGNEPFRFWGSDAIYLANNTYSNHKNEVTMGTGQCYAGTIYACSGTTDAGLQGVEIVTDPEVSFKRLKPVGVEVDFKIYPCRLKSIPSLAYPAGLRVERKNVN